MAKFKSIDPASARSVANQLEPLLSNAPAGPGTEMFGAATGPAQLAESIEMWTLDGDKVNTASTLAEASHPLGQWHHQLLASGRPVGHATSTEGAKARLDVASVHMSDALAHAIDEAIKVIDGQDVSDDIEVRLLSAPEYHLHALWLPIKGRARVAVLGGVTSDKAEARLNLEGVELISETDFLDRLRSAGPVGGFFIDTPK